MSFPVLNLNGINRIHKTRVRTLPRGVPVPKVPKVTTVQNVPKATKIPKVPKVPKVPRVLQIPVKVHTVPKTQVPRYYCPRIRFTKKKCYSLHCQLAILFFLLLLFGFPLYLFIYRRSTRGLRSIQKIKCEMLTGEYLCTSLFDTGVMLITMDARCKQLVYEVSGIPFVRIRDFDDSIFEVPARREIRIKDVDLGCKLKMHHTVNSVEPHQYRDIVWITTAQHTEFTLAVDDEVLLDQVPTEMLNPVVHGRWIAYSYSIPYPVGTDQIKVQGNAAGAVHVYGNLNAD